MLTGIPADDRERYYDTILKRTLADYLGDEQVMVPVRDFWGRNDYWDATWTMPWGDIGEFGVGPMGKTLGKVHPALGKLIPRQMEMQSPILDSLVGMKTGRNAFTGKPIIEPGVSPHEGAASMAHFFFKTFGPPLFMGHSSAKLRNAGIPPWGTSRRNIGRPDVPGPIMALLSQIGGVNIRQIDPMQSMVESRIKPAQREAKQVLSSAKRHFDNAAVKKSTNRLDAHDKALERLKEMEKTYLRLNKPSRQLLMDLASERQDLGDDAEIILKWLLQREEQHQ
jgi:hypothetical protein